MSQTVKIDEAAQAAIAEIVGMPWTKDYYDNTLDEDRDFLALVERSGASVRVLVKEGGYIADMWHFEAEQIGQAILRASTDAKAFQKAQTEWAGVQMQRLNCEITGSQNMWGYGFYVNGRHYEVNFTTREKARTCVILNQAAKPIFHKVTDDVRKALYGTDETGKNGGFLRQMDYLFSPDGLASLLDNSQIHFNCAAFASPIPLISISSSIDISNSPNNPLLWDLSRISFASSPAGFPDTPVFIIAAIQHWYGSARNSVSLS